jgi:thiol:disulfide interchange protein
MNFKSLIGRASVAGSVSALMLGAVALGATAFVASTRNGAQALESQAANGAKASAIAWQPSFEVALAQSKASGKPVMVDFGATWCGACRMMEEQTYPDAKVIAESKNFVMVKVDVDEHQDIAAHYGISSLPTTAWLRADGTAIVGAIGALEPGDLIAAMREASKRAQSQKGKPTT